MDKLTFAVLALFASFLSACASSSIPKEKQKDYALLDAEAQFGSKKLSYIVGVDQHAYSRSPLGTAQDVLPGRHVVKVDACVENSANLLAPFCKTNTYIIDAKAGLAYLFVDQNTVQVYDRFDRTKHIYDLSPSGNSYFVTPEEASQLVDKKLAAMSAAAAAEREARAANQAALLERRKNNLPLVRKIGTRICQDQGDGVIYTGYVERLAEEKVQIRISSAFFKAVPSSSPKGFTPSIIWDSPMNWDLCE